MHLKLTESRLPFSTLLLIAPFFLWGTAMVAMKGTLDHTTPLFLASVRLLPAGLLILVAAMSMGRPQPQGWLAWTWIGLFGLVDGTLFQGFLAEGLARTGAGLGSVMIDSQPLAVALMARLLFGEQVGLWGWLGLAFGVVGISFLGIPQEWLWRCWQMVTGQMVTGQEIVTGQIATGQIATGQDILQQNVIELAGQPTESLLSQLLQNGQWLMLLAALSMAVGTVMVRYVSRYADPVTATGWHMVLGSLPLVLGSGVWESQQWQQLQLTDWTALAYATVFGSAIAYGLFFYFASSGNLTSFSSLTFLTPVFALLFGNLFLGETLDSLQWVGVTLTLVSIFLINQRDQLWQKVQAWRTRWNPPEAVVEPQAAASLEEVNDSS